MPDGRTSTGDSAQIRLIVEQVVEAAIVKLGATQTVPPPVPVQEKAEIPQPLKWAATIVASLMTAGIVGLGLWLVTTLNEMQVTVARIDERQQSQTGDVTGRFEEVNRRITRLEAYHVQGTEKEQ